MINPKITPVSSREFSPTERNLRTDWSRFASINTRNGEGICRFASTSKLDGLLPGVFRGQRQEGLFQSTIDSALTTKFLPRADRDQLAAVHNAYSVCHFFCHAQL